MYTKSFIIDTSLYSFKYIYFVSVFIITSMLLYVIFIRGSFNIGSLIIKSRATKDYTYLDSVDIYSFP